MKKKGDESHSFASYFKRATSSMVVLKLLNERPAYAYELSQMMKKRSDGKYTMSLLYPLLYRLEEQGLIALERKEISPDNRVRSYYQITEAGKAHLTAISAEYEELVSVVKVLMHSKPDKEEQNS